MALTNHCLRSFFFATALAEDMRLQVDLELLFVSAMLHDMGLTPQFDARSVPFEDAGGSVGWVFATGLGWRPQRAQRVREVIQKHAWPAVEKDDDAEAYLLEAATSLDVAGRGFEMWEENTLRTIVDRYPRLNFAPWFDSVVHDEAGLKPGCHAARFDAADAVKRGQRAWSEFLRSG